MESVSKRTGKVFKGRLAEIMHRVGAATLVDGSELPKKVIPKKVNKPNKVKKQRQPKVKK
jgi:hypothetical protein